MNKLSTGEKGGPHASSVTAACLEDRKKKYFF